MSRLIEKPNIAMSITTTGSQLSSTVSASTSTARDTAAEDVDALRLGQQTVTELPSKDSRSAKPDGKRNGKT